MLQYGASSEAEHARILQQSPSSLGIDSLVAVEVRSWISREFDVGISVAEILDSPQMKTIVDKVLELLPRKLIPRC